MTASHRPYDEGRLLDVVHKQFDRAAEHIDMDPGIRDLMKTGQRDFVVHFPCAWTTARYACSKATECSIP